MAGSVGLLALFPTDHGRLLFQPNNLDIFCIRTMYTHMIRFLYLAAGYTVRTTVETASISTPSILHIFRLARAGSSLTVNIIVTMAYNAMIPIFKSPTTLLMNIVTGTGELYTNLNYLRILTRNSGIFSAYGEATTSLRGVINSSVFRLNNSESIEGIWKMLRKYEERGFTIYTLASDFPHICTEHPLCPSTLRSMIDTTSFILAFSTPLPGSRTMARLWNAPDVIMWGLGGIPCPGRGSAARIPAFVRRAAPVRAPGSVRLAGGTFIFAVRLHRFLCLFEADNLWRMRVTAIRDTPNLPEAIAGALSLTSYTSRPEAVYGAPLLAMDHGVPLSAEDTDIVADGDSIADSF